MKIRDYVDKKEELIPVQVKLEKAFLDRVKSEASKINLTITDLVRASFKKFLEEQKRK